MATDPLKPPGTSSAGTGVRDDAVEEPGDALADYRGPIVLIVGILAIVGAGLYFRSYQEKQRAAGAWAELDGVESHAGTPDEVIRQYEKLYADYGTTEIGPAIQLRLGAYCMKVGRLEGAEKAYRIVASAPENTFYPIQGRSGLNAVKRARDWATGDVAKSIADARQRAADKKKKEEEDRKKAEEERKKAEEERRKAEEERRKAEEQKPPAPPEQIPPPAVPPGGSGTSPAPPETTPTTSATSSTSSTSTTETVPEPPPPPK